MATRDQLATALRNADKAGDTDAARRLARAIMDMDAAPTRRFQGKGDSRQSATPQTVAAAKARPLNGFLRDVGGAVANFNRGTGVLDEVSGAIQTGVNVATGRTPIRSLSDVPKAFEQGMAMTRATEDDFSQRRPNAAALARGTGMASTVVLPGGPTLQAAQQGTRAMNVARGVTTAATQGALMAAADRGSVSERLSAATQAATSPLTVGLGATAGALAPAARKAMRPDVAALVREGVDLTPGQVMGGAARTTEESLTSVPIMGDAIDGAYSRGREKFFRSNIQRALNDIKPAAKPEGSLLPVVGGASGQDALRGVQTKLPDDIETGPQAVAFAQKAFDDAYEAIKPTGGVRIDDELRAAIGDDLTPIVQDMTPDGRQQLKDILDQRITSRLEGGAVDGDVFKRIESELTDSIGRFSKSTDVDQQSIGEALKAARDALRDAAARQNPEFGKQLRNINRGYSRLATIERAASKAGTEGGVPTPKQFQAALREGDKSVRRRRTAAGQVMDQDIAQAGVNILSQKTGDSGSAGRIMQAGAIGGGVMAGLLNPATQIQTLAAGAGLAAGTAAYSKPAMDLYNKLLRRGLAREEQAATLEALRKMAATDQRLQSLYQRAVSLSARSGGATGSAQVQQQNAPPIGTLSQVRRP